MGRDLLVSGVVQATPDKLRSSYSVMKYHKEGPACGRIPYDPASSEADCEYPLDYFSTPSIPNNFTDIFLINSFDHLDGVFFPQFWMSAISSYDAPSI